MDPDPVSEILERVRFLNDPEKSNVLAYIDRIPEKIHNTKIYRQRNEANSRSTERRFVIRIS